MSHRVFGSASEVEAAKNTLMAFLSYPQEIHATAYSRSSSQDVATYFPATLRDCDHCNSTLNEKMFTQVAKTLLPDGGDQLRTRQVLENAKLLLETTDSNMAIFWCLAYQAFLTGTALEVFPAAFKFVIYARVPNRVAKAFGTSAYLATVKVLEATEEWGNLASDQPARERRKIAAYREETRRAIEAPVHDLAAEVFSLAGGLIPIITQRILLVSSEAEAEIWFEAVSNRGLLRTQDWCEIIDTWKRKKQRLPADLKSKILSNFSSSPRSPYFLRSILSYCDRLDDAEFAGAAAQALADNPDFTTPAELQAIYEYSLESRTFQALNVVEKSPRLLVKVDLQTLDWLYERRLLRPNLSSSLSKIAYAIRRNPSNSNYFGLIQAIEPLDGVLSDQLAGEVREATRKYLTSKKMDAAPRTKSALALLFLGIFIKHPEIENALLPVLQDAIGEDSTRAILEMAELLQSQSLTTLELWELVDKNRRFKEFALLPIQFCTRSQLSARLANVIRDYFLKILQEEVHLPSILFESFLLSVVSSLDKDTDLPAYLEDVLDLPAGIRINELNRVLLASLRSGQNLPVTQRIIDVLESRGIPLSSETKHQLLLQRANEGSLLDYGVLEGPQAEYWSQLAVIFDDVVHEINQPLLALGLSIETLKNTVSDDNLRASKAIAALDDARKLLATRIIHYQALAGEGNTSIWIKIDDLIRGVLKDLEPQAQSAKVKLSFETSRLRQEAFAYGPPFQLKTAIRNLVKNSIAAFTSENPNRSVVVSLFRLRAFSSQVMISIEDTGPGIPEEEQSKIFQRGFTTKAGRGLGLGLSLSSSVINSMGGTLKLDKTSPSGSVFLIVLPVSEGPVDLGATIHEDLPELDDTSQDDDDSSRNNEGY